MSNADRWKLDRYDWTFLIIVIVWCIICTFVNGSCTVHINITNESPELLEDNE